MMLNLDGYQQINLIYTGSRTFVYQAIQVKARQPVIIKVIRNPHPNSSELIKFRNQYIITRYLEHPAIQIPLSLERYGNGYALVMPDRGAIALIEYWQQEPKRTLTNFLKIAMQLADALNYLNQKCIIHKDIKPSNILIHPETQQIELIDFSISTLLPKEQQQLINPKILEGTLAYISPEQTGRMNRGIDYRTDFYSLGVTFFELLTGKLPFESTDPVELIHCHLSQRVEFPNDFLLAVPEVLQRIVLKLMAKNAEDRYQSAWGLKYDLEKCLAQLESTGEIKSFELGERDIGDRFIIPEKLYGREQEVKSLLDAFERVANPPQTPHPTKSEATSGFPLSKGDGRGIEQGRGSEMILVAGFSGIGKTAVVNEVHKPIVRQRGYFIKGKYDQFNRNIPFSAFVQAFRDLMNNILSESDASLANWQAKILEVVGENGEVIINVIPELEQIIGKQPPVPQLSGNAAQNRFNLLFSKFVCLFATKDHPLVIFLDDLQWGDMASLNLLKVLMGKSEASHLLVLGAYRDNEVFPAHPFMLTLEEIQKQGTTLNTLLLKPLDEININHLVAETLLCSTKIATPLSQLIYQKTGGNPFFTTQFLHGLYQDGWITFDSETRYWQCNLTQVRQLALTDNVVTFMVERLRKLPEQTQNILKLAACIGNRFDLETLAMVCEYSEAEIATDLWGALQEGFVIPESETYKFFQGNQLVEKNVDRVRVGYGFLHDRVQQAAYALIPERQKQRTHYHIGQLLLQKIPLEAKEERIFELVNQLNYGTALITEQQEQDELAKLNLIACRKARNSTAYQAGVEYAKTGLALLGEKGWQRQYEISRKFHELGAELASLCGDFPAMEKLIETAMVRIHSLPEQVNIYRIKIQANGYQNQLIEAITVAQQFLEQFDITFPENPSEEEIQQAIVEVEQLTRDKSIEELTNLPMMIDGEKRAIVQIASSIMATAYILGSPLFPLLVALAVKLSIQSGNIPASVFAYVCYSVVACFMLQDVNTGVKFGQLAFQLLAKFDDKTIKPEVLDVLGGFILHRKSHIKETLPVLKEGYLTALEVGNMEFAGYNINKFCLNSIFCGYPMMSLEREIRNYCNGLIQLNQLTAANYCQNSWQAVLNLLGLAENPTILSGEVLQETEFLEKLLSANDLFGLCYFYLYKLILCYQFEEFAAAQNHALEVKRYLMAGAGTVGEPVFYLYDSLALLVQLSSESEGISEILEQVEQNQIQLQEKWANYAPMNHQHKADLVAAEKCRVLGEKAEAIALYDRAIYGAKENEYLQEEALANELTAKFYLNWGKEKVAASYMQEAYYCYARWEAIAKTKQLEQTYPQLLTPILKNSEVVNNFGEGETKIQSFTTLTTTTSKLDVASAIQASQALSKEIELEVLISKLMHIVLKNAGADKSILILHNSNNNWEIVAQCNSSQCNLSSIPVEENNTAPTSIINSVKRTKETILINNLEQDDSFILEPYLNHQKPKSLCCTPILSQNKIIGILYLENSLTSEAFTPERIEILNLLTVQAAISIENARLYQQLANYNQNLEAQVKQRTQELQEKNQDLQQTLIQLQHTQTQLIQTEKMSSLGRMIAGIAHEINNPINFITGNISHAREYFHGLLELLELYKQNSAAPSLAIQEKIKELEEELDLDFVCDDLEKILNSMANGGDRISKIILGLRNFSRLDQAKMKRVDIHEGLDNTLMILQHRLKAGEKSSEIVLVKNYGKLPLITCYASQLNQVFLHIISNAIDALGTIDKNKNPTISITTEIRDAKTVRIRIIDNGPGMSDSIRKQVYDPFFTTKPVGQGTGLGLSISYQIITEQHQGQLQCISELGKGTEFIIDIPIQIGENL
ncbi:MAG: AAA family ATPase [Trichodesmium sp.]